MLDNGDNTVDMVGSLDEKVIKTFNLKNKINQPIFCGDSNRDHMKSAHPDAYKLYGDKIKEIINEPDYISKHPNKSSIEYIKIFNNENDDHVLVAVRATGSGKLFARTLFIMDDVKVSKYTKCGAFKKYK